jgi:hypothetical protein
MGVEDKYARDAREVEELGEKLKQKDAQKTRYIVGGSAAVKAAEDARKRRELANQKKYVHNNNNVNNSNH